MKIIADQNMPQVQALFAPFGDVHLLPGREIKAQDLLDADVLLVRSVTQVNADLLEHSNVRFVGSATIGTDHIDLAYLQMGNIHFAHAPGCNAEAVVQYDLSVMCHLMPNWQTKTVGIVGCGNVGARLYQRLSALGVSCQVYDPFLPTDSNADLVEFDALYSCDILCLHTPITINSEFPTHHLFNDKVLARLKPDTLLINAGRGAVVDNRALLAHLRRGAPLKVALDVWESEPCPNLDLMALVALATPHIAGYSLEGKTNGTAMVFDAFLKVQGLTANRAQKTGDKYENLGNIDRLDRAILSSYDVMEDDKRMRAALCKLTDSKAVGAQFDHLRKHYPLRREFSYYAVTSTDERFESLGFRRG